MQSCLTLRLWLHFWNLNFRSHFCNTLNPKLLVACASRAPTQVLGLGRNCHSCLPQRHQPQTLRSPYLRAMMVAARTEVLICGQWWKLQMKSFPFLFGVCGSSKERSPYLQAMMEVPNEELPVLFLEYGSSKSRDAYQGQKSLFAGNDGSPKWGASLFFSVYMVAARTEVLICGQWWKVESSWQRSLDKITILLYRGAVLLLQRVGLKWLDAREIKFKQKKLFAFVSGHQNLPQKMCSTSSIWNALFTLSTVFQYLQS